jgi:hypothetical protein
VPLIRQGRSRLVTAFLADSRWLAVSGLRPGCPGATPNSLSKFFQCHAAVTYSGVLGMIPLDEKGKQSGGLLFFVVRGTGVSPRYVCRPNGTPATTNLRDWHSQGFVAQEEIRLSRSEAILVHWQP